MTAPLVRQVPILVVLPLALIFTGKADADHFKVFINNNLVNPGVTVGVAPGTPVQFEVRQPSGGLVEIDLTGDGKLRHNLTGRAVIFPTVYQAGTYHPRITVGSEAVSFTLSVSASRPEWLSVVDEVASWITWPLVVLVMFGSFFFFGGLRNVLRFFKPAVIDIRGVKLISSEFELSLRQAVDSAIQGLERAFSPELSNRFIPLSLAGEAAYYVHVVEFLDSLKIPLKNAAAWNLVGTYYFISSPDQAQRAYERAIADAPQDPSGYANLGMLYLIRRGDQNSARRNFQKAVEVAESRNVMAPWAYIGMAGVLQSDQERQIAIEKARVQFEIAIMRDPTDYWAFYGLGWCWKRRGDVNKAMEFAVKARDLKPDFAAARYNLACYKAIKHDAAGAVAELRHLLDPIKPTLRIFGLPGDSDFNSIRGEPVFQQFLSVVEL